MPPKQMQGYQGMFKRIMSFKCSCTGKNEGKNIPYPQYPKGLEQYV